MTAGRSPEGASLGPYEIRASLGQGGGGEVYRAWDPRLERDVALKILHERFENDPERVRAFVAEARAASALNHANIVTVFDAAVDGSTPYIVSEVIDGRPLRDEMNRGAVPLKRLLDLATQIADGLAAAHEAGIKHGDLKPENIMVTRAGRAKILDFGLTGAAQFHATEDATRADDRQTRTEAGLVAGTVPYMSPEQARGGVTDLPSDQFSFGLILYEMATGRRAFRRDSSPATLDAIINDEAPDLRATDPRIPVQLSWIIERCLAKDSGDRYGATADLHRDLKMLRDRLGDVTVAATGTARATRWPRVVGLIVASLILVVVTVVVTYMLRAPAPPDVSGQVFHPVLVDAGYQGHPAWRPDGQVFAYVAEVDGTLQIFTRKMPSGAPTQITHQASDCTHPFWSPDGQRIYYVAAARLEPAIWSIGATEGTVAEVVVLNATRGAISRDGRTLAFLRDETRAEVIGTAALYLATPEGSPPWNSEAVEAAKHRREFGTRFIEGALSFSPDGTKLGVCVIPGPEDDKLGWQFWIVPMPTGKPYRRLESWSEAAPRISSFTWMPDGQRVVFGVTSLRAQGSHLWMADLQADRAWALTSGPGSESYPSASRNGDILFTSGEPEYDLVEISPETGAMSPLAPTARSEFDPEFSTDGRQLAYVTDRRGQDEIWIRPAAGRGEDGPLIDQTDFGDNQTLMLNAPTFSRAGDRIAYQRNGYNPRWILRVWWKSTTAPGPSIPLLPSSHQGIQGAPTWSRDGKSIAFAEWNDNHWQLVVATVGANSDFRVLRKDGVANATPKWSPTGEWITWETDEGFQLVSPTGKPSRPLLSNADSLPDDPWLVHTWSADGSAIIGIMLAEHRRLALVKVPLGPGAPRKLADLGVSPPVNNPVRGLSTGTDGRMLTSVARLHGDLWMLKGARYP
jgi:Tol biopolymer transport system component